MRFIQMRLSIYSLTTLLLCAALPACSVTCSGSVTKGSSNPGTGGYNNQYHHSGGSKPNGTYSGHSKPNGGSKPDGSQPTPDSDSTDSQSQPPDPGPTDPAADAPT